MWWKRTIATVCIGAIGFFGAVVRAEEIPQLIFDLESGETWDQLTTFVPSEDVSAVPTPEVGGKSSVLMELSTGEVLIATNEHAPVPIASVTKIMTLLLVMEAIDDGQLTLTDEVVCSATAASMGGSQIWLEEGECMTVHELLKAAAVVSANDACAALAEKVSGSIEGFVARMNERAKELGMNDTNFLDCSGLNDEAVSSAYDVAVMSRELMKHDKITEYTTIWMDSLRNGASQLVNTNKLVRFYDGATGLKTGTTSAAGHCLAATAARDEISFVAVILGCSTTDERFGGARKMLDYGFANYTLYRPDVTLDDTVRVLHGTQPQVSVTVDAPEAILLKKGHEKDITSVVELDETITAPVEPRQAVGTMTYLLNEEPVATYTIRAAETVSRMTVWRALGRLLSTLLA